MIKMIVCLGNPEKDFENTRHNAGFKFADFLLKKSELKFEKVSGISEDIAELFYSFSFNIFLLKPKRFVNNSGEVLQEILKELPNCLRIEHVLVAHDNLFVETGEIKVRFNKGSTHNGVKSIVDLFGKEFYQLQLGIKGKSDNQLDRVLSDFSVSEMENLNQVFEKVFTEISFEDFLWMADKTAQKINMIKVAYEESADYFTENQTKENVFKNAVGKGDRKPYFKETLVDRKTDLWKIKDWESLPKDAFDACLDMALFDGILEHYKEGDFADYRFEVATDRCLHDYLLSLNKNE